MIWLILGVVLWSATHLLNGIGRNLRGSMISRFGAGGYKGLFSLTILASMVMMVVGWRASVPHLIYLPPAAGRTAALVLMLIALILFAASGVPTNIKRFIRHPQLTGVAIWSLAHLLSNGDSRSIILFGGIGAWALLEMPAINRREGPWQKPQPLPLSAEIQPLVGGIVIYVALLFAHPYLFNVSPL